MESNLRLLEFVHEFVHFIDLLSEKKKIDTSRQFHYHVHATILLFLTTHNLDVSHVKNIFGIDINEVFRKYAYKNVLVSHKKLIL